MDYRIRAFGRFAHPLELPNVRLNDLSALARGRELSVRLSQLGRDFPAQIGQRAHAKVVEHADSVSTFSLQAPAQARADEPTSTCHKPLHHSLVAL